MNEKRAKLIIFPGFWLSNGSAGVTLTHHFFGVPGEPNILISLIAMIIAGVITAAMIAMAKNPMTPAIGSAWIGMAAWTLVYSKTGETPAAVGAWFYAAASLICLALILRQKMHSSIKQNHV